MIAKNNKAKKKEDDKKIKIINFYTLPQVQAYAKNYWNPNFERHKIKVPFRLICIASSGGGKSNLFLNIISVFSDTFHKIIIYTQNRDEQLYNWLSAEMNKDINNKFLDIYEGLDHLNNCNLDEEYDKDKQYLIIFDDQCNERDQSKICELYIRGRKLGSGCSLCYLTQSYYKCPKLVRDQANYILMRKVQGTRDLNMILKDCSLSATKEQLLNMYEYATYSEDINDITNFLMIDKETNDPNLRYRKNFDEVLNYNEF